jgi:hypothetical protein
MVALEEAQAAKQLPFIYVVIPTIFVFQAPQVEA